MLPKFWRPKLSPAKVTTQQVLHWDLITRITAGLASAEDLWSWIETGFTCTQMMHLLIKDGAEFSIREQEALAVQLAIYEPVIARFKKHKRVGFSGGELAIARAAAVVMDALVAQDRHGVAAAAAEWSAQQMRALRIFAKMEKAKHAH